MTEETKPNPSPAELLEAHIAELANVQSQMFEMEQRRRELQAIVATLKAVAPAQP